MKKILAIGNQDGITAVACPKCGTAMELMDGGYRESFTRGEYTQTEYGDYWRCPACGFCYSEQEPMPDDDWDWLLEEFKWLR